MEADAAAVDLATAWAGRKSRKMRFRTWTPEHTREESERLRKKREEEEEEDAAAAAAAVAEEDEDEAGQEEEEDDDDDDGLDAASDSSYGYHSDSFAFEVLIEPDKDDEEASVSRSAAAPPGPEAAAAERREHRRRVRKRRRKARSLGDRGGLAPLFGPDADPDEEARMDREVEESPEAGEQEYRVYPMRFVVLVLFGLMSLSNAVAWIAFAPVQSLTEEFYGISVTEVNMMTLVYSLSYIPMTPLVSWVYLRYSLRTGVLLGGLLTAVGTWIRVASVDGLGSRAEPSTGAYGWLLFGQILCGLAQPFFNNATSRLSATWFSARSRGIATTVAAMMNPIGAAVGQLIPPFFVERQRRGGDRVVVGMPTNLWVGAAMATVPLLLAVFLFESKPPTPPSRSKEARTSDVRTRLQKGRKWKSASLDEDRYTKEVRRELATLRRSKHYRVLLLPYAMGQALFIAFLSQLEAFVRPIGYSEDAAGRFGALAMVSGLVGSFVMGTLMDRTHKIREVLKASFWGAFLAIAYTLLVMRPGWDWQLAIGFVAIGFFTLPVLPVALEAAAETTYPVNEDISGGLLNMAGNALSFVTVNVLAYLIDEGPERYDGSVVTPAAYFYFFWALTQATLVMFYQGPYKRWWHDKFTAKRLEQLQEKRDKEAERRRKMYRGAQLGLRAGGAAARARKKTRKKRPSPSPSPPPALGRSSSASAGGAAAPAPKRAARAGSTEQEMTPLAGAGGLPPAPFRIDDSDDDNEPPPAADDALVAEQDARAEADAQRAARRAQREDAPEERRKPRAPAPE